MTRPRFRKIETHSRPVPRPIRPSLNPTPQPVPGQRPSRRILTLVVAAGLLLAFGLARLPLESSLDADQRDAGFRPARLGLSLRERLGQTGFLAALSGFRAPLADFLVIQAYGAWEQIQWGRVNALFQTATTLQPRSPYLWEMASWQMAYNAARNAREDIRRQPREILRVRAEREYLALGRDFLERGIANNPRSPLLHESLGRLLLDKLRDPAAASVIYARGAALPGAPAYLKRFAAYALARAPGREREAHEMLRKLYDLGPQEHLPTLLRELRRLEESLSLPAAARIPAGA